MRDHFEGTEHDPYSQGLRGDEPWRPISVFRTYEAHVLQVRPWLPKELGEVIYVAMGMADLSVFLPFYAGLSRSSRHLGAKGSDQGDSGFRLLEVPPPADARHDGLPEACADRA